MPNREITRRNKKKYLKEQKYVSEETNEVKRFVIILFSIIVCIIIVYFVSNHFIKKNDNNTDTETKTGEIDYNTVSVGTILNRKEEEYYVLVYDQEDSKSSIYATYGGLYTNKENAKALYYCNLANEINKDYVASDGKSNPGAKKIEDLKFGEITLLKIKNKKIVKYLEDVDTIKKELGL